MLKELFFTFFKIGIITFGGGYAMIANFREELVEKKKWISDEDLAAIIAVAESTPGPIAINTATFVGYKKRGVLGGIVATLGVVMPSLIIIYVISLFLEDFMQNKYVAYAFKGIKCAVAFLVLRAGIGMFKKMKKTPLTVTVFSVTLALLIVAEIFSLPRNSILLIAVGGIIGITACLLENRKGGDRR